MTEKKDVKDIIQKEETHLNNLLEQQDLTDFKGMVDELTRYMDQETNVSNRNRSKVFCITR